MSAPKLTGESLRAVEHRGSHMQIIASAGSGKTEVVSQRVASLLDDGVRPDSIVAFTFTERAAAELKSRIAARAEERMGRAAIDHLSGLFVGTIHAYCFRLLQTVVPRYETYDVLDPNQLTAFLVRESNQLEIRRLDDDNKMFSSIEKFLRGLDVVENEMLDPADLDGDFGDVLSRYFETLERYRLLTFGQQVVRAVHELARPEVAARVHETLRHLIVDEYQDVNPAQEALIKQLVAGGADLCVVGDDDQAIYQWRGSDVGSIVSFAERYPNVEQFTIVTNRRSRPTIIETANAFASTIPGRLDKEMLPDRDASTVPEVVAWSAHSEQQEAGYITHLIDALHDNSFAYRDIAVLVRGKVAYRQLLDQFAAFDVPVQPGGRSGLFDQPEAEVLGRTFAWLGAIEWGRGYGPRTREELGPILDTYAHVFDLDGARRKRLRALLQEWKLDVPQEKRPVDLIRSYYVLLDEIDVKAWDLSDPTNVNRLGTLARFSMLLADYETVRRRARPDAENPSEQVGGNDRGLWYYKNLGIHIVNYAANAYGDFDGEEDVGLDAVDLLTVHSAKGLEWPAVLVPSLTLRRFPSSKTGQQQKWPLPRTLFDANRYEGSDADERRLFYVAMTRARDWLSLSRHDFVGDASGKRPSRSNASPYFNETSTHLVNVDDVVVPTMHDDPVDSDQELTLSYSELHQFLDCAMQYRLRTLLGFQPRLAPELGYGKAVHHMLRRLAEVTKERGAVPNGAQITTMLNRDFFLPIANKPAHRNLKEAAQRLLTTYAREHQDDLFRVWEVERPFELRLDGITVIGRADVILDQEGGVPTSLAILDYKTSTSPDVEHDLQLQVYANAGRREGLDVSAAYVHDLKADDRAVVEVNDQAILNAELTITAAAVRLRAKAFEPNPGSRCTTCEVRAMCSSAT